MSWESDDRIVVRQARQHRSTPKHVIPTYPKAIVQQALKRGPKIAEPNPLAAEVALLQKENARLALRLKRAEAVMEVQKKVAELLGIPLAPNDGEPCPTRSLAWRQTAA